MRYIGTGEVHLEVINGRWNELTAHINGHELRFTPAYGSIEIHMFNCNILPNSTMKFYSNDYYDISLNLTARRISYIESPIWGRRLTLRMLKFRPTKNDLVEVIAPFLDERWMINEVRLSGKYSGMETTYDDSGPYNITFDMKGGRIRAGFPGVMTRSYIGLKEDGSIAMDVMISGSITKNITGNQIIYEVR